MVYLATDLFTGAVGVVKAHSRQHGDKVNSHCALVTDYLRAMGRLTQAMAGIY